MIPRLQDAEHDRALSASAHRVLRYFGRTLSRAEFRERKVLVIARELQIPERSVKRAIAQLLERGYIETAPRRARAGVPQAYRLVGDDQRSAA